MGVNDKPGTATKAPRKPRDPNAPKRAIMPRVPDGHKRIFFDVPESVHSMIEQAGQQDDRSANDFARVTILRHARKNGQ